ncbi:rifampicin phosphotransferase-like isoform X2 [Palaemon carinicauda]|uniref:rifampicin phosphotransferase-like isoform X2 n=1 Tax=Palaemon carinicauda TaxID=392227 RepID=UPI0035B660F3
MHWRTAIAFLAGGFYFIYWFRWFLRLSEVWIEKFLHRRRMNNFDLSFSSYYTCGLVPTQSEQDLESPKPLLTDRHEDSMQLFGMDKDGRAIVARIERLTQRRASLILVVVDSNGDIYTLPGQPDTNYVNVKDSGWKAGGLLLECVEAMRCWRLKFNGLLRRGARKEFITDAEEDDDDEQIIHARLDFLWHCIRAPVDVWRDASTNLLAQALADQWRPAKGLFSLVENMSLERDEYEQWGALHGEIRLGGLRTDDPQVWYLRGCRRHRWGLTKAIANFHRSVEVFSYFSNGDVCSLQACSYGTKMSHYQLGYMQKAKGTYLPITYTDLSLPYVSEDGVLPHDLLVKFRAGGKDYDLWHKLGHGVTLHTGDPWSLTHKVNFNSVAATHNHGWGITIFSDRYNDLCPVPERECHPPMIEPQLEVEETGPFVVGISDYLCRATCLTGGKGASLGQLSLLKDMSVHPFEVPNGIVVTVSAWRKQLRQCPDLQQAVRVLEQAVGSSSQQQMRDACGRAVELFKNTTVCSEIQEALKNLLEEEFEGTFQGRRFAVRSSGCAEDGDETSAAGQNETLLGVEGLDSILKAITTCWASQFTFQSVEYRRQRGQAVNDGMGVVVQEMVEAEVAGVIFTLDPVTGNPANITISANYGLGESVVSASSDPDTIVVHRTWRDHLSVTKTTRGEKKTKHVMNESGGTSEVTVEDKDREQVCLSNEMALRLAEIALFLQEAYGSPRDLEFAVIKDTVYLLQARPVTSLDSWTEFELIHEHDTGLLTDHELLTKANVGEVLNGAVSTLTSSIVIRFLEIPFQREIVLENFKYDPHNTRLCVKLGMHVFLNMLETMYRVHTSSKDLGLEAADIAIHGKPVITPDFRQKGIERFGITNTFKVMCRILYMIYIKFTNPGRIQKAQEHCSRPEIGQDRAISAEVLYAEITRRLPDMLAVSDSHMHTSIISSFTQSVSFVMLSTGQEEFSEENYEDMASLLSTCSGVESADVPSALKSVAQVIAQNEEANDFLSMTPEEGKVWLESHPGKVGTCYRSFLSRHGHRCLKEIDFMSLSWSLDPRPLVESLQAMVRYPSSNKSRRDFVSIEEAIRNMKTPVSDGIKKALKYVLPMCRDAVVHRETTKSQLTKMVDIFRKAYLKLGQMMTGEGRLPEVDLIFFLTHSEIGHLVKNRSPLIVSKAIRRKRLRERLENLIYPDISYGMPKPINEPEQVHLGNEGEDLVLTGTAVCQGVVKGIARVVTSITEATNIQRGDILVTKSTDVGWTPYFPLLAGVVTEIGGLISHGAVVAREYGLPCIVGVRGATHSFNSGDSVVLNATKGTITRIWEKKEELTAFS